MNKKPSFKPKMPYARSKILTYTKEKGVRPPESTSVGMERVPVDAVAGRVRGRPPSILPQEAVEKAMGELRKRIVEGQRNFRTHNMNKDANTLNVVITEIDARYPKAKEVKP